jgi:hypothetical protein
MTYNACIQTQGTTNNCVGSTRSCKSILQHEHQQQSKSALHAAPREFYNKAVLELNGLLKLEPECSIDGHPFLHRTGTIFRYFSGRYIGFESNELLI